MREGVETSGMYWAAVVAVIILLSASGCSSRGAERDATGESARLADSLDSVMRVANDITLDAEAYADSMLLLMRAEERVGMLYMPAVYADASESNIRSVVRYAADMHVGGFVLLKGDLRSASIIADTLASLGGAGFFIAVDAENGLKMRFPDAPEFPWSRELGHISDDQLLYEFGNEIARECREVGVNMVLGPVMDIVPGERSHGLMRKRSLGSNPRRVAELALAYSHGLEDGNVISVAKHFPGHGSASADSHRALGVIRASGEALDSIDLYPFARYCEEGLSGVMVGHLAVAALDTLRRPAIVSPVIMGDVLRERFGFRGLVITDAINMEGAMGVSGWEAIAAGADIVIAPADTYKEIRSTLEAMAAGKLDSAIVADRCRRILFYKYLAGMGEVGMQRYAGSRPGVEDIVERVNRYAPALRDSIKAALHRDRNSSLRNL